MKRLLIACTLAAGAVLLSAADGFRQTYPLDPAKVKQNEARVQADLKSVPAWADGPFT